jgi:hypothetical protein
MKRAAKIGSMDRQTLRDWVHRFNASTLRQPHGKAATGWEGALALEMRPLILFFIRRPSTDI